MSENKMVCYCRKIDTNTIKNAVANGITDVKEMMETTTAGTACGMCVGAIERIISEETSK